MDKITGHRADYIIVDELQNVDWSDLPTVKAGWMFSEDGPSFDFSRLPSPNPVIRDRFAWALARYDIEANPERYGFADLVDYACASEETIEAIATAKSFMFEGQANHIFYHVKRAVELAPGADLELLSRMWVPKVSATELRAALDDGDQDTRL